MDRMPFYLVVFHSIPEIAILISLGLTLLGFKPKLKIVLVIASLESLASFLIRSLPLPPGINVFIQLPILVVLTACFCSLNLLDAALTSLLGLVVLALTETAFNFLISAVSGIAVQQALEDPLLCLLFPLPEFVFLTGVVLILRRYNLTLFDIQELKNLVNIPELAALLLVKMGIASLKNISFTIEVESNLKMLRVKAIDLNTVVGNLVDNAFEAVESLASDKKTVALRIFETGKHFVFQTVNPGFIEKELRDKIFEPGFSTKPGNRGIGLASVKSVVNKNRGKILVSSIKDRGTKFAVMFPKQQRGR